MRRLIAAVALAILLITLTACTRGGGDAEAVDGAPSYATLDEHGTQLRDDFNRFAGSVRLLFVIDPACGGCLRGLDDIDRSLLASTDDPRLELFVVHVPVIGGRAKNVTPAAGLVHNARVHHYWNPSGEFGRQLAEAVGLEHDGKLVYAWDVWLIYGPEATWDESGPPRPQRLMHQLYGLEDHPQFPLLDGEAFAREVRTLLASLPQSTVPASQ